MSNPNSPPLSTLITDPLLTTLHSTSATTESLLLNLLSLPTLTPKSHTHLLSQLAHLRTLHRQTTTSVRHTKTLTSTARSDVDALHLLHQNLLYEQSHLRSEIDSCASYSHSHYSLPMESAETFLASHPGAEDLNAHDLMLARIEAERKAREELEGQRVELVRRKQALVKENLKRKEDLQGLDKRMEAFIDAARPIEKVLGLVGEERKERDKGEEGSGAG